MGRGRINKPNMARDGIWYQHRGQTARPINCRQDASTASDSWRPKLQPLDGVRVTETASRSRQIDTREHYRHSRHDNRSTIDCFGEIFGEPRYVGKRISDLHVKLHSSDGNLLHNSDHQYYTGSLYNFYYRKPGLIQNKTNKARRYPKDYLNVNKPNDTDIDRDVPVDIAVLGNSQQPLLKGQHKWKYSYQGSNKAYPDIKLKIDSNPYDLWSIASVKQTQPRMKKRQLAPLKGV